METSIVGRGFSTENLGMVDSSGYWTVTVKMIETVHYDDGTSKSETIESSCMDRDFDMAHRTALSEALVTLRHEVYDKGLVSLVEAREQYGRPSHDNRKIDGDTPTQ